MQMISLADIQIRLRQADWNTLPRLQLAVLRNIMLEPIEPYLRYEGLNVGMNTHIAWGAFDQILQEATMSDGPVSDSLDAILVFPHLYQLSPRLFHAFSCLSPAEIEQDVAHILTFTTATLKGLRAKSPAMILWASFESPPFPAEGILDDQQESGQTGIIRRLNTEIGRLLKQFSGAYLVNLDRCRLQLAGTSWVDNRLWQVARCPYSLAAMEQIAQVIFRYVRALKGLTKKCLVLDCDNTLWGGIIGEDGVAGIQLGHTHPGSSFRDFQQTILNLFHQGVLIALCSKNNPADVFEVFDKHPDMLLRREHLAAVRINWADKAVNLREIAAELNIGLDSLVFIDDSRFEFDLVRQLLPEVTALHFPAAYVSESATRLQACGLFDKLSQGTEDRNRTEMYRAEARRKAFKTETNNLNDYLRSLEMEILITIAEESDIPRLAQLTQKTNQFNLTTRRYTEDHVRAFMNRPDMCVYALRLRDRFGDSGLVGMCIFIYENPAVLIDSFLLSCRVLGRGVEQVFLAECIKHSRRWGAQLVKGCYIPTAKNSQTQRFYVNFGFKDVAEPNEAGEYWQEFGLNQPLPAPPPHFSRIIADFGEQP